MQIRLMIDGKEIVVDTNAPSPKDGRTREQREATEMRRNREIPSKRSTKRRSRQKHASDWNGCGAGSNSNKGYRGYAGMLRAIAAEDTGCAVASKSVEIRLQVNMIATTDPKNDGMRVTDGKGARRGRR